VPILIVILMLHLTLLLFVLCFRDETNQTQLFTSSHSFRATFTQDGSAESNGAPFRPAWVFIIIGIAAVVAFAAILIICFCRTQNKAQIPITQEGWRDPLKYTVDSDLFDST
jgi:membrane-associated phospholipid phosphatase